MVRRGGGHTVLWPYTMKGRAVFSEGGSGGQDAGLGCSLGSAVPINSVQQLTAPHEASCT